MHGVEEDKMLLWSSIMDIMFVGSGRGVSECLDKELRVKTFFISSGREGWNIEI